MNTELPKISDIVRILTESGFPPEILRNESRNQVVVVTPQLCGRIFCSSFEGDEGRTKGFVHEKQIRAGFDKSGPGDWNNFGGEERLWFAPEGGPGGFMFPDEKQTYDVYAVNPAFQNARFQVTNRPPDGESVTVESEFHFGNYLGAQFDLAVQRKTQLLEECPYVPEGAKEDKWVGYGSETTVRNIGKSAITKDPGALAAWTAGQFLCSPRNIVVIPYHEGSEEELGPEICGDYFKHVCENGVMPEDQFSLRGNRLLLNANGKTQTKIDLWKRRTTGLLGAVDLTNGWMTFVDHEIRRDREYIASYWLPYGGDRYDGAAVSVFVLGGTDIHLQGSIPLFYELETFSPALLLEPGEEYTHRSTTYHVETDAKRMDSILKEHFNSSLQEVEQFDASVNG